MRCPHCGTENRDDRASCYHCSKDLALLRLIVNKAKQHFNNAVELAGKAHHYEALGELNNALELNSRMEEAHVLRGTVLARLERFDEAREAWERALALNPEALQAARHLGELGEVREALPLVARSRRLVLGSAGAMALALLLAGGGMWALGTAAGQGSADSGWTALRDGDLASARDRLSRERDASARAELMAAMEREFALRLERVALLRRGGFAMEGAAAAVELRGAAEGTDFLPAVEAEARLLREELLASVRRAYSEVPVSGASRAAAAREMEALALIAADSASEAAAIMADADARAGEEVARVLASVPPESRGGEMALDAAIRARRLADGIADDAAREAAGERVRAFAKESLVVVMEGLRGDALADERLVALAPRLEALPMSEEDRLLLSLELQRIRVDRLLDRMEANTRGEALALAQSISVEILNTGKLTAEQEERYAQLRSLLAARSYYALMDVAEQLEFRGLSEEQAQWALAMVNAARHNLPPRLESRAEENLIFFSLRVHQLLGNHSLAKVAEHQLAEEFPNSPYLAILR